MKTIKKVEITPTLVEFVPEDDFLSQGVIYISKEHRCAVHLCLCGCKNKSVTPLTKDGWQISFHDADLKVSLTPSILNTNCPKRSHYIITKNIANFV